MSKRLLRIAYEEAKKSPDPSTQNGAVIVNYVTGSVIVKDHNRFPDGVLYKKKRWERPDKYKYIEHAERNVIYKMSKKGIRTLNTIMVCPWAACSDCARAIIQSGISTLVTHKLAHDRSPEFWQKEINIAFKMFEEANIHVVMYDKQIGGVEILHCGEKWQP